MDGAVRNPWGWTGGRLRRVLPESVYLRYVGRHEQMSMRVWEHLAARLPEGSTVLDIGAYHGEYALAASGPGVRVVAFEPNPASVDVLRQQTPGVEVVEAAVSAEAGVGAFMLDGARSQLGTGDVEVKVVALDDLEVGDVRLVKIDVEGFEADVISGGRRLFAEHRPTILCEVLTDSAGARMAEVLPDGYSFWRIDENRGLTPSPVLDRVRWRDKNWLLVG